jgi:hypothetical protein
LFSCGREITLEFPHKEFLVVAVRYKEPKLSQVFISDFSSSNNFSFFNKNEYVANSLSPNLIGEALMTKGHPKFSAEWSWTRANDSGLAPVKESFNLQCELTN